MNVVAPDYIFDLKPNEIFVYGANRAFRHGAGAAKQALEFGARHGVGPFCGQTYGICTKDEHIRTLSLGDIRNEVESFALFAASRPNLTFLVTAVGTGLAGYTALDIAPFFVDAARLPNVHLPKAFWEVLDV